MVDVWQHNWINRPTLFKSERTTELQGVQFKVADLIDQSTRTSNSDVVEECFRPDDARIILQFP